MNCRYCGTDIQAGAAFCPGCGKPVESSEFSSYEYSANDQPVLDRPPGATPVIQAPTTPADQPSVADQSQPAQALPSAPTQYAPPAQPVQPPFPAPQPTPGMPWPAYQGQQPAPHAQWPAFQGQQPAANMPAFQPPQQIYTNPQYYQGPPFHQGYQPLPGAILTPPASPPQKRGISPTVAVLLVVLALLVGGGGVFAYYALSHRGTATPTTNHSAASPTINASDPQQLYMQATSGKPGLNDPLNTSNPNGWEAVSSGSTCTFPNNTLQISSPATTHSGQVTESVCLALATNFSNFAYQVNTTIVNGDVTGIVFRNDPFAKSVYFFGVGTDGSYALFITTTDATGKVVNKILSEGTSQAIHTAANQSNMLTVIARGSTIDFYANQQHLNSVTDNSAVDGVIGVFGENTQGGAITVSFNSIKVWQI